jgi:tRNA threonylcarbamoyladenosine biosynthesis protein TsaE
MALVLKSGSQETSAGIGAFLSSVLEPGDVLCLEGPLGTGKTVLVRGLARGRGWAGPVPSPTFTIINPYPEIGLCHVDAFRLSGADELVEAGIEEYLDGDWVCAVEWAERVRPALPARALEVSLAFGEERLETGLGSHG